MWYKWTWNKERIEFEAILIHSVFVLNLLFVILLLGYQHIRMYDINSSNPNPVSFNSLTFILFLSSFATESQAINRTFSIQLLKTHFFGHLFSQMKKLCCMVDANNRFRIISCVIIQFCRYKFHDPRQKKNCYCCWIKFTTVTKYNKILIRL